MECIIVEQKIHGKIVEWQILGSDREIETPCDDISESHELFESTTAIQFTSGSETDYNTLGARLLSYLEDTGRMERE